MRNILYAIIKISSYLESQVSDWWFCVGNVFKTVELIASRDGILEFAA